MPQPLLLTDLLWQYHKGNLRYVMDIDMLIIYYLITISLILLGFLVKKSKGVFVFQFIWMWILAGWNCGGPDYQDYIDIYQASEKWKLGKDVLYNTLGEFANDIGLSFDMYNIIIVFIGLCLISSTIFYFTQNTNIVMSLMLIFPLIENVIQRKNFIAMAVMIFSIRYLYTQEKKNIIKFLICILIAMGFHSSAVFYFIFVLAIFIPEKKIRNAVVIIVVLSTGLYPVIIQNLHRILPEYYVQHYFLERQSAIPLTAIWHVIGCFLTCAFLKYSIKNRELSQNQKKFLETVVKLNWLTLITVPIYSYDLAFYRYYRNIFVLLYIGLAILVSKSSLKLSKFQIYKYIVIGFVILSFLYLNLFGNNAYQNLMLPIYQENYILQFIDNLIS